MTTRTNPILTMVVVGVALLAVPPLWVHGDTISLPHTFKKGGLIKASEFNSNFAELKRAIEANASAMSF